MLKMIGRFLVLSCSIFMTSLTYASGCSEFEAEAEAFEGLVPKFDDNGKLRALLMYGEGNFLVPKRSLINDARRNAELKARRSFAEFMKSNFESDTVAANMVNTKQQTDQDGNTSGMAEELTTTLDTMRQQSNAVLSGIVKLDECVDTEGKYVLVQMGWKPATSEAAADAKTTMLKDVARGDRAEQTSNSDANSTSKIKEAESYRKKSTLADDF